MAGKELTDLVQFLANVATFVAGCVVVVGLLFARRDLRAVVATQRFTGAQAFYDMLDRSKDARKFVYNKMTRDPAHFVTLSAEERQQAEDAVNFLNRVSYLLKNRVVPHDLVFQMTHSMLIRLGYQLQPFIEWRESQLGARWGRPAIALAERALRYHKINPLHREKSIYLERSGEVIPVYTPPCCPWIPRSLREIGWRLRWYLNRY